MYLVNVQASHAYCFMVIWYITRFKSVILQKLYPSRDPREAKLVNMGSLSIGEIFQELYYPTDILLDTCLKHNSLLIIIIVKWWTLGSACVVIIIAITT